MNKKYWICLFFMVLMIPSKMLLGQEPVQVVRSKNIEYFDGKPYYIHTSIAKQTLYSISKAYEVSVEEILDANPELKYGLKTNQRIRIPATGVVQESAKKPEVIFHEAQRQETVYGISYQYGISIDQLYEANPGLKENGLKYRQVLRIPLSGKQETSQESKHIVEAGETLFSVSRKYNTTVDHIKSLNQGIEDALRVGQEIIVPYTPSPMLSVQAPVSEKPVHAQIVNHSYCDNPEKKSSYNIALLIPFYLSKVDSLGHGNSLHANHPSLSYIQFYEGFLVAVDSMKSIGGNFKIHVFDVGTETIDARKVLLKPELNNADLIIGPFFPENLALISEFAKNRNIPVVSPLLPDRSFLKAQPLVLQLNPGMDAQLADLARYIACTYNDQNIILVHNQQTSISHLFNDFKDSLNFQINSLRYFRDSLHLSQVDGYFFKDRLVGERTKNIFILNDSILLAKQKQNGRPASSLDFYLQKNRVKEVVYRDKGIDGIKKALDPAKKNIIITLIAGEAFVSNYVRELNQLDSKYQVSLFGVSDWAQYENIEVEYLQNLNTHLFTNHFIDYRDEHIKSFIRSFRAKYKTEPDELGFRGVQAGMYFLNALHLYGSKFYQCLGRLSFDDYTQPYYFEKIGDGDGWENHKVYIYRYNDYMLLDVRKPSETSD